MQTVLRIILGLIQTVNLELLSEILDDLYRKIDDLVEKLQNIFCSEKFSRFDSYFLILGLNKPTESSKLIELIK